MWVRSKGMKLALTVAMASLSWMALAGAGQPAAAAATEEAIRAVLLKTWDKPDTELVVGPVVVVGDHAVAGWTQGARGGRALLKLSSGSWSVVLCSGDPLKRVSALMEAGVPGADAQRLEADLSAAEQRADPERVRLFATFEGVMRMEDAENRSRSDKVETPKN